MSAIPAGYKQTEVGVIPADWEVDSIVNLAAITTGDKNTQDRIDDGAYPFFVRSQTVERINSYSFDGEAVLTAGDGVGTGKIFHYIKGKFDIHQRVYKISDFGDRLDGSYFYRYFSNNFYSRIMQMTAKSSVDSVRREMIADMRVPLPEICEQRAIAAALSDVDALLAKLDQFIAKKRDLKQAAMQQLLTGQTRLPGFCGEWSPIKISKHASLKARIGWQALTTAEYLDEGAHFLVTGTDFVDGRVNWSSCHYVDQWRYDQDRNIQLRDGDVLLTKDGTIGKVGYVDGLCGPATLNSGVFVIRPLQESFAPLFLFYILKSKVSDEFLAMITAGSTIVHLYQKDFVTFEFLAPSRDEQTAIATVLSDIDAELAALEARRDKTRALKQGMMQELLTGRIRLV
ncbi:MAG: restriction endonuclease subunit S [Nitrosomonas sp.]|uniref:restriction endonuclease subunit S n=2 Tax=Nitrosomonas sp. TaxID=42353 RepID=UPI002734610C|nr:restriction endonuclease subunit S [Nitrosomonas sp.]MDP3664386.1 restriction endonuclease subunit S [Nitrosomonas sp.]MDZ4107697.1 restriction endonuclease subunit S [Nitrosomonas sp.]